MKRLLRKKAGTSPAPSGAKAECLLSLQIQFRFCLQGLDAVKQLLACFHSVLAAKGHPHAAGKYVRQGSGLRFDSEEGEYVQVQGAIKIPNTVEVWLKLDENETRRQIIMNNYGRDGTTWGIEVTTSNTLRY